MVRPRVLGGHKLEDDQIATRNDVTGDPIKSKVTSKEFLDNWDAIFNKKFECPRCKSKGFEPGTVEGYCTSCEDTLVGIEDD